MASKTIIEPEKFLACLPGYENLNPGPLVKKLSRRFRHKSGSELRLELEQRQKLLVWNGLENLH